MAKRKSKAEQVMDLFTTNKDEALVLYGVATAIMRRQGYLGKSQPKAAKSTGQAANQAQKPAA